jgi:hypothetical protein
MQAAIIQNGIVTNLIVVDSLDILPGLIDGTGATIGDGWDGTTFFKIPAPTPAPVEADYVNAVQTLLDTTAQTRHYDNILSACTYVGSTVQKFSDEGTACRNWRDAVWAKCYDILAQVEAGTLAQPTVAELLAMLPTIAWPA